AELLSGDAGDAESICAAAALRRAPHDHRVAVVGESAAELVDGLESFLAGERRAGIAAGRREPSAGKLGFVFSGMGAQWAGMGRRLFDDEPVFAESLRRSEAVLRELAGWALIDDLFAPDERTRTHDG